MDHSWWHKHSWYFHMWHIPFGNLPLSHKEKPEKREKKQCTRKQDVNGVTFSDYSTFLREGPSVSGYMCCTTIYTIIIFQTVNPSRLSIYHNKKSQNFSDPAFNMQGAKLRCLKHRICGGLNLSLDNNFLRAEQTFVLFSAGKNFKTMIFCKKVPKDTKL